MQPFLKQKNFDDVKGCYTGCNKTKLHKKLEESFLAM